MFFCDDNIFMVYRDDGIFLGSNDLQLQDVINKEILAGSCKFKLLQCTMDIRICSMR
jgi:hypothetical protein